MRIILEVSAKELAAAFEEVRKRFINTVKDFSAENDASDKPEAPENTVGSCDFNVGFLPIDNEVNKLLKAQTKLRRQLHSSSSDPDKLQEQYETKIEELEKVLSAMRSTISETIIGIALRNDDFICTECLNIASKLYRLLRKYARKRDADWVRNEFKRITGRDIYG